MAALTSSIKTYFGEVGLSNVDPKLIRFDERRSEVIIACQEARVDELQASVALIVRIGNSDVAALTLKVSGTIKSLTRV
jgi:RNase P/RNase MRP subunit POP5